MVALSFLVFLAIFVVIGVSSTIFSKKNTADYLLANSSIKPWIAALSAVATTNSGYMFIGMIGYTYLFGLSSIWLMFGWIIGDFLASLFIHKKIRITVSKQKILSFSALISDWFGTSYKKVRILSGLITIIFLAVYAAAQLKAGSKALHVIFGWDYAWGAIIGAIIVVIYCFAGGIRASIWTDVAQSFVMFVSMLVLLILSVIGSGSILNLQNSLTAINADYLSIFPDDLGYGGVVGGLLFIVGWLFGGFGVVGQPHIMVRFMALQDPQNITSARYYYYGWYSLFYLLTIATGMVARIIMPDISNFDAELVLPKL